MNGRWPVIPAISFCSRSGSWRTTSSEPYRSPDDVSCRLLTHVFHYILLPSHSQVRKVTSSYSPYYWIEEANLPRNLLAFYCAKRRRHDVDFNQLFNNVHGLSIIKDPRDVNLLKTGKLQLSSALNSQQTIESTYFSLEHSLKIGTLSSDYRLKNLPRVGDFLPFGHFNTG